MGGCWKWISFFWNRLTRILPIHYLITFIILCENPAGIANQHILYHIESYQTTTSNNINMDKNAGTFSIIGTFRG
jgi:hypothetical protein